MYTLKIHFTRHVGRKGEPVTLDDEMTEFIPADKVTVHGVILGENFAEEMKQWDFDSYTNLLGAVFYDGKDGDVFYANGRLIRVERDGAMAWYLASRAWLLGPDGKTIERIAP